MKPRNRNNPGNGRLLDTEGLMAYIGTGRNTALKFGSDAGAVIRIGRRLLFDKEMVDRAIEQKRRR